MAKRVRKQNSLIHFDGSQPLSAQPKNAPPKSAPPTEKNGRYSQNDKMFLEDWFRSNDVSEPSFQFTDNWANETVFPAFQSHLSASRRNSVFAEFSGWVYTVFLQYSRAKESSNHEENQEDNLNDDGMQTRLHSSSRPSDTHHSDTESKASSSWYRKGDGTKALNINEREAKENKRKAELEGHAQRGAEKRRRRQEKIDATERRIQSRIKKATSFLTSPTTKALHDGMIIMVTMYPEAKKCFQTAKSLKMKLSQFASDKRCTESIIQLTKVMDGLLRKCSLRTETWDSESFETDDDDEESEIFEEHYSSSSGDEKDKAKDEKLKERKSATRKMHASQNQLATKLQKLNSTMFQISSGKESSSSQQNKIDQRTELLKCDDDALHKCDALIAEQSKVLLESLQQRSRMLPFAKDPSQCVSLTFGTTPNDGTYQIHANAPRDTLMHSIFEAKYACHSEEVVFDVQAGMTVTKPFRTIDRNFIS